jgi:hypothetical protein
LRWISSGGKWTSTFPRLPGKRGLPWG